VFGRATIRLGIGPHSSFDAVVAEVVTVLFVCNECAEL